MSLPPDAFAWLRATALLVALWTLVAELEWVTAIPAFRAGGLLHVAAPRGRVRRWLAPLLSARGMTLRAVVRLAGTALLLAGGTPLPLAIGFALVALVAPLPAIGRDLGDGSDKMGQIVSVAGLIGAIGVAHGDGAVAFAGVLLAGGQLTLCYLVSGVAKLLRPEWRSGRFLDAVMRSEDNGHPHGAVFTRDRTLCRAICWALMLSEALFPLALLAPEPVLIAVLAAFLAFHLATAYLMGLNTFALAFPAAYPAVLLLGGAVRTSL